MTPEDVEEIKAALRKAALDFVSEVNGAQPPGPKVYDITTDELRSATQSDVDKLREAVERGTLQRQICQNVLMMGLGALRELKKFLVRGVVYVDSGDVVRTEGTTPPPQRG